MSSLRADVDWIAYLNRDPWRVRGFTGPLCADLDWLAYLKPRWQTRTLPDESSIRSLAIGGRAHLAFGAQAIERGSLAWPA